MRGIFHFCDVYPADKIIRWATYASVSVALILIFVKAIAWWVTHSLSLQASLIDSTLDLLASLVNLFAVHTSLRPPDSSHRFGHEKAESLAALFQSAFIVVSAGWLLCQVVERFMVPVELQQTLLGLQGMLFSIMLTYGLITYQGYVIQRTKNEAIIADRLHYYSDLLTNGSVFISLCLVNFFSIEWIDPLLGGFIALYILKTSWDIVQRAVNILMDHEVPEKDRQAFKEIILSFPEVDQLKDFRTRTAGTKQFIQFYVVLKKNFSLEEVENVLKAIKVKISLSYPHAEVMIQPLSKQD